MKIIKNILQNVISLPIEKSEDNWKTNKIVSHSLHYICSRICSFPPSLPSYFIEKYTKEGDIVFDAWSGKGSVPFEALRNKRIGIGNDKSPDAFVLTHAKVRPIDFKSLKKHIIRIKRKMKDVRFTKELSELDRKAKIFYSDKTFEQIRILKETVKDDNSDESVFVKAIMLGLLHGKSKVTLSLPSSHSYSMSPTYVKKYAHTHNLRRPSRDVLYNILIKGEMLLKDPLPSLKGIALNNDSRNISLPSESVDLIVSSPPYFNIQTYAWCNWLRLWFLGYDYKEVRKQLAESGSETKYYSFMKDSIKELYRVLKPGGHCFLIVGDVKRPIKEGFKTINIAEFILPLLQQGFGLEKIIVDSIPSGKRVMNYIGKDDGIKIERIICLRKASV